MDKSQLLEAAKVTVAPVEVPGLPETQYVRTVCVGDYAKVAAADRGNKPEQLALLWSDKDGNKLFEAEEVGGVQAKIANFIIKAGLVHNGLIVDDDAEAEGDPGN